MVKASMHVAYYLFLLTFCIDEGDGRWKKTDKEILQRDIKLYKKIAERVEHDLEAYYDEYEEDDLQRFHEYIYQANKRVPKISTKEDSANGLPKKEKHLFYQETKSTNEIPVNNRIIVDKSSVSANETKPNNIVEKLTRPQEKWPKFEDILLAMGKKYDWKNDRWIKVKEKFKNKDRDLRKLDNSVMFHEKHRFIYRSIKLNRGKNKRNVVIAVTAIR